MNWLVGTGLAALAAGSIYYVVGNSQVNVYDMPVEQAYRLLTDVDFAQESDPLAAQRSATGNGSDLVTWTSAGSHSSDSCDIALAPAEGDANRTYVTVNCAGGSATGPGKWTHNVHRNNVIERVDATLTGRPYDRERAGSTAARWPEETAEGRKAASERLASSRSSATAARINEANLSSYYDGY